MLVVVETKKSTKSTSENRILWFFLAGVSKYHQNGGFSWAMLVSGRVVHSPPPPQAPFIAPQL